QFAEIYVAEVGKINLGVAAGDPGVILCGDVLRGGWKGGDGCQEQCAECQTQKSGTFHVCLLVKLPESCCSGPDKHWVRTKSAGWSLQMLAGRRLLPGCSLSVLQLAQNHEGIGDTLVSVGSPRLDEAGREGYCDDNAMRGG